MDPEGLWVAAQADAADCEAAEAGGGFALVTGAYSNEVSCSEAVPCCPNLRNR